MEERVTFCRVQVGQTDDMLTIYSLMRSRSAEMTIRVGSGDGYDGAMLLGEHHSLEADSRLSEPLTITYTVGGVG